VAQSVIVIAGKDPGVIVGGTGSYLRAYGRAAIRAGYEPHHFCASTRSEVEATDFGTIHRTWSPFRPFRGLMVAAHQRFVVDCIDRFVGQRAGPHLIHSFGPWSGVGVAAAGRLRKRGIETITLATPFSTYSHETRGKLLGLNAGYSPMMWLQHWCEYIWTRLTVHPNERRGLTGSQLVLPNYDSVRAIIQAEFGGGIRFGRMTYSSEAAFLREGRERTAVPDPVAGLEPRDAPLIVSVSRHDLRKGLDIFLHALAMLRARGIPFRACLVGGGQLLETHRQLAARLGLAECTAVVGRVPDSYAYLEHADVFALPSLEEGSGSVSLLEAMQAGAAPVVSRLDGLPEDVSDGESALLLEPGDPAALATSLGRLLRDAELRARIKRGAHQRYLERFSAEAFAADLQRIYSGLGFDPASPTSRASNETPIKRHLAESG
jgi:glycosyltransferase involved in cell wall biosynthesis